MTTLWSHLSLTNVRYDYILGILQAINFQQNHTGFGSSSPLMELAIIIITPVMEVLGSNPPPNHYLDFSW